MVLNTLHMKILIYKKMVHTKWKYFLSGVLKHAPANFFLCIDFISTTRNTTNTQIPLKASRLLQITTNKLKGPTFFMPCCKH